MHDPHISFRHDREFEIHQVVVIFVDTARQRVLNRNDGACRTPLLQSMEQILKPYTGKDFNVSAAKLAGGFFAESAALALECDDLRTSPHRPTPSQRRT